MSHELLSRSPDLARLVAEGYAVRIVGGHLVLEEVPYVDRTRRVRRGRLISDLSLRGDVTSRPTNHVAKFDGERPCDRNGEPLQDIFLTSCTETLCPGLESRHQFSSKPPEGYVDYHHKMSTYASILAGHASVLEPGASACAGFGVRGAGTSVFAYLDTASAKSGLAALSAQLEQERVGIIGLGGTGSYVLDQVAKTPVQEIHLFDDDALLQHNAFRAPGAVPLDTLRANPLKVEYYRDVYSRMHHGIHAHAVAIDRSNLNLLDDLSFVFISIDRGGDKRLILEKLEETGASFIDVGMGLELVDGSLGGIVRTTASTPGRREPGRTGRIPLDDEAGDNVVTLRLARADLAERSD